jgi:hypothetical protein
LRRADHSSRGAIPIVVRRYVWFRNLKNEKAVTRVEQQRHGGGGVNYCRYHKSAHGHEDEQTTALFYAATRQKTDRTVCIVSLYLLINASSLFKPETIAHGLQAHPCLPVKFHNCIIIIIFNYVLQPLRLILRSGLDVPTFATRRLHACHRARAPSGARWNVGREMSGNFA